MENKKDEGWYCWLAFAAMTISMLMFAASTYGTIAVLLYTWIEMFNLTTEMAVLAPAVLSGSRFLPGPLISLIIEVIGIWRTHMLAGVLLCVGAIATSFATQFWHVVVSYSLLQGLAAGAMQITSIGVVSTYFDKYKDKVYAALMTAGHGGILIGPVLTEYLLDATSYRTTILIGAAADLLIIPAALIYRGTFCSKESLDKSVASSYNNGTFISDDSQTSSSLSSDPPCDNETSSSNESDKEDSDESITEQKVAVDVEGADIDMKLEQGAEEMEKEGSSKQPLSLRLKTNVAVIKDPVFILYMFYFMTVTLGENTYFALAVNYSVSTRGIFTLKQASFAMTVTGICTVIGSFFVMFLSHWSIDRQVFGIVTSTLLSLSLLAMPLVESPAGMFTISVVFGLTDGMFVSGISSLIQYQFGHNEQFLTRFSYLMLMVGVGSVIGPIGAGYLGTVIEMKNSFYFLGGVAICGPVASGVYVVCVRVRGAAADLLIFPVAVIYRGTIRPEESRDKFVASSYNNQTFSRDDSHTSLSISPAQLCDKETSSPNENGKEDSDANITQQKVAVDVEGADIDMKLE
ncbi:monocarboxylate transporter 5-like [Watersipora subatra]|uniref:monocarboxylate transporter 5-like n=1 Tax=Watersipora subatra TaxID=2589382 RepID=UPI00355C15E7